MSDQPPNLARVRPGQRSPLDRLRQRFGALRVNVLTSWASVSLIVIATTALVSELYTRPAAQGTMKGDPATANAFATDLLLVFIGVETALSALVFALLFWGVVRPVERQRAKMQSHLSTADQEKGSERLMSNLQLQRRREQLEAALEDNEELRGELERTEQRVAAEAALLKGMVERIHDPVLLIGLDGRISEASRAACDLLALRRSRLVGSSFDELFKPPAMQLLGADPDQTPGISQTVLATRSAIAKPWELRYLGNAEAKPMEVVLSCALGDDTQVLGLIATVGEKGRSAVAVDAGALLKGQRDNVTQLPAQELFERRALEVIETARAQMSYHTLMLIGIDNLGDVTERHGLKAAEQLRWHVARVIEEHAGSERELFQFSHDRFVVLSPYRSTGAESDFADRVCLAVESRPYAWREARFESTVSVGAIEISPLSEGLNELMEHANQAFVAARQAGGNQAQIANVSQALLTRRRNDAEWISWALSRLEQGYAHLISQAIVPMRQPEDGLPRRPLFECFVRIEDEDGVWVSPDAFLPAMERRQLSHELDLWVIGAVLRELSNNPGMQQEYECAGINLSSWSLRAPDFSDRVASLLERSRIEGSRLCFEINESDVASQASDVLAFIERMRPLGIRFALDRYRATGGLHCLRDTPLDYVKIHPSLLTRLHGLVPDEIDLLHLSWINRICAARGIASVATGVEYEDVAKVLRELETDYAQGVHINKIGPLLT